MSLKTQPTMEDIDALWAAINAIRPTPPNSSPAATEGGMTETLEDALADLRNLSDTFRVKEDTIPCGDRIELCTRLGKVARQLSALRQELSAARGDKELLDWLEANLTRLHELDRDELTYRLEYFTDKQEHLATTAKSIRHAIAAAMQSPAKGEK